MAQYHSIEITSTQIGFLSDYNVKQAYKYVWFHMYGLVILVGFGYPPPHLPYLSTLFLIRSFYTQYYPPVLPSSITLLYFHVQHVLLSPLLSPNRPFLFFHFYCQSMLSTLF